MGNPLEELLSTSQSVSTETRRHPHIMSGRLTCMCGKCVIQLANPTPKCRLECGCADCRQAARWATLLGGPPAPLMTDAWYFDNDLTVVSGAAAMRWYKQRDTGRCLRLVATCCHST